MVISTTKRSKPKQPVRINFESKSNSKIYLLAVDRGVNLLKKGNNIDKQAIEDEFSSYNAYTNYGDIKIAGDFENDDRYIGFGTANAFILTNAYKGELICLAGKSIDLSFTQQQNDVALTDTPDKLDEDKSLNRTEFPETWLFEEIETDSNGLAVLNVTTPDSITSWDISAFATSDDYGLGIAEPISLTVLQDFFVTFSIPYSIIVGEILKVDVIVFNSIANQKTLFSNASLTFSVGNEENDENDELNILNLSKSKAFDSEYEIREDITIAKNSPYLSTFYIQAKTKGMAVLTAYIKRENSSKSDKVTKILKVKTEGKTKIDNRAYLVSNERNFLSINTTKLVKIEAKVIGSLMGPALEDVNFV